MDFICFYNGPEQISWVSESHIFRHAEENNGRFFGKYFIFPKIEVISNYLLLCDETWLGGWSELFVPLNSV